MLHHLSSPQSPNLAHLIQVSVEIMKKPVQDSVVEMVEIMITTLSSFLFSI